MIDAPGVKGNQVASLRQNPVDRDCVLPIDFISSDFLSSYLVCNTHGNRCGETWGP